MMPQAWRLFVDGAEGSVSDVHELRPRILAALRKQFAEVQLVRGERPEHALFALFNDGRAVMSYTRNIDETCFSARSDGGTEDGEMEFYLSNGQRDEYPRAHTIPSTDAVRTFEYFFQQTELLPSIRWHKEF